MNNRSRTGAAVLAALCLSLSFATAAFTQNASQNSTPAQKGAALTAHATGTFEVKVAPPPGEKAPDPNSGDSSLGRMTIDKQFHGDLEGTSKGQMLTAGTASGTLQGRSGTFVLQHSGTMTRGAFQLTITVVPDSGTGQLAGLSGTMNIIIADGKHSYDFAYTLPATP